MVQFLRKLILPFVLLFFVSQLQAQAPQLMNYQAVVRDGSGQPLSAGTNVTLRFQIHDASTSGAIVYTETGNATTNQFGLVTYQIGYNGNLAIVNWGNGAKYLQVLIDATGGSNFTDMGTTQLLSVPYALYAGNSLNGSSGLTGATGAAGTTGANGATGPTGANGVNGGTGLQGIAGVTGAQGLPGATGQAGVQGITGAAGNNGVNGITGAQGQPGVTGNDGQQGIQGAAGAQGLPGVTGQTGIQGIQGVTGNDGAVGATGIAGNDGAHGLPGMTGQTGVQGVTGATGNDGAQGVQGVTGADGTQGIQGITGNDGAIGATGATGNDGAQGVQGVTGADGAQGLPGVTGQTGIQGVTGNDGAVGATGNDGIQGIQGITGNDGPVGATGATGNDGAQGVQGVTGADGAQGVQGVTGNDGSVGATGATGNDGVQGVQGVTGADGVQGLPGVTGQTGIQGVTGNDGAIGATGNDGAQGVQGVTGADGVQGIQGVTGNDGAVGATGATGNDGAQGATGADGAQGIQGITGNDGAVGATGATGNDGAQGLTGQAGIQGVTGADGVQGIPGVTGNDGAVGATGATGNDGAQGIQGVTGTTGNDGQPGDTGATGAAGNDGAPGATGLTGPTGNDGTQGMQGATGADGNDGAQGDTGPSGATGATGVTGLLTAGAAAGNTTYWDGGQWVTNSSNIYNDGGRVGINTTSPGAQLEVNGTTKFDFGVGIGAVSAFYQFNINNGTGMRVAGPALVGSGETVASFGGYGSFEIDTPGTSGGRFTVLEGGNVGIGTNNPTARLDVVGSVRFNNLNNGLLQVDASGNVTVNSGAGSFIVNSTAPQNGANFNVDGNGTIGGNLQVNGTANGITPVTGDSSTQFATTAFVKSALDSLGIQKGTAVGNTMFWNGTTWVTSSSNIYNDGTNIAMQGGSASNASISMGIGTTASGSHSTAVGVYSTASGPNSVAMGNNAIAGGNTSTAFGNYNTASGDFSTAMGGGSVASGYLSTAIGNSTTASGSYSTAMGAGTIAGGSISIAMGNNANAPSYNEIALGTNNTIYTPSSPSAWVTTDRLFGIGNGVPGGANSDAMVILKNGNTGFGLATPTAQLHTTGTVRFQNYTSGFLSVDANGNLGVATGSGLFTAGTGLSWSGTTLNSKWTTSGNNVYNNNTGNVGIGTGSPLQTLSINGSAGILNSNAVQFYTDNGSTLHGFVGEYSAGSDITLAAVTNGNWLRIGSNNAPIAFFTDGTVESGTAKILINASGQLGVGTISPSHPLDVAGDINASTGYTVNGAATTGNYLRGNGTQFVSSAIQASDIPVGSGNYVQNGTSLQSSSNFNISGNGYIGGNVGIGTTTPAVKFDVENGSTSPAFKLVDGTQSAGRVLTSDANGNATWQTATTATGTTHQIDVTSGVVSIDPAYTAALKAQAILTGGGNIVFDNSAELSWTNRFIVIDNGTGSQFSTNGFFEIDQPAQGTVIPGVDGTGGTTVTAGGIPLNGWQALYYILPIGSNYNSQPGNFVIAGFGQGFAVPENWLLIAERNGDDGSIRLGSGPILQTGQTWNTSSATSNGSIINGTATQTNANFNIDGNGVVGGTMQIGQNGLLTSTPDNWGTIGLGTAGNGYYGVAFGNNNTSPIWMFDGNHNGGLYDPSTENWINYYNSGTNHYDIGGTGDNGTTFSVGGTSYFSGNAGFGTNNPQAPLDVAGTGYFENNLGIGTSSPQGSLQVLNGFTILSHLGNTANTNYGGDLIVGDNSTARAGYNTTNGANIMMQASGKSSLDALDQTSSIGQISYQNRLWTLGEDVGWGTQTISVPGSMGIGTSSPSVILDVEGGTNSPAFKLVDGTQASGRVLTSDANGNASWTNPVTLLSADSDNIYNHNGTLTGNRTIAMGNDNITFAATNGNFYFTPTGTSTNQGNIAMGSTDIATGGNSLAVGYLDVSTGNESLALGLQDSATANQSIAMGYGSSATAGSSIAMGQSNKVRGANSISMGQANNVTTGTSYAIGYTNTITGGSGMALGQSNSVTGASAVTVGNSNTASAPNAMAFGYSTTASGNNSSAFGQGVNAKSYLETATGAYNTSYTPSSTTGWVGTDRIFGVGNGQGSGSTSDAMVILKNGSTGLSTSSPVATLDVNGNTLLRGANTGTPLTPVSAVELLTGRTSSNALNGGQTSADIAIQFGGGGYRHFIASRHNSVAGVTTNAIDFYINNSTTAAGSSTPGTGNVQMMSITAAGVGIGTTAPNAKLDINGSEMMNDGLTNTSARPAVASGTLANGEFRAYSSAGTADDDGFMRLSAGAGTNADTKSYIDLTGYSQTADMLENIVFGTTGAERMRINASGQVGIGTSTPGATLDVNGSLLATSNVYFGASGSTFGHALVDIEGSVNGDPGNYYFVNNNTSNTSSCTSCAYSLYTSARIWCGAELNVTSDERTKKVLDYSDKSNDLASINKLKVVDYKYIDQVAKGSETVKGFLAQDVEQVFPDAVNKNTGVIPNIYRNADNLVFDAASKKLIITVNTAHGLAKGDNVQMISDAGTKTYIVSNVVDEHTFVIYGFDSKPEHLFVYGKEVNDIRNLDYNKIFSAGISAIQELSKQVDNLKAENADLKGENCNLNEKVDALSSNTADIQLMKEQLDELKSLMQKNGIRTEK